MTLNIKEMGLESDFEDFQGWGFTCMTGEFVS